MKRSCLDVRQEDYDSTVAALKEISVQNTAIAFPQGEAYKYETEWESSDGVEDTTLHITRSALFSPSQLPDDIVNRDVMDTKLPNLFFCFESKKYGVYCDLKRRETKLREAIWRVRRESGV